MSNNDQQQVTQVNEVRQEISGLYCRAVIDKHEIILSNIRNIEFRQWIFDILPRVSMTFRDDHLFFNISTLKDTSKLTITLAASEGDIKKSYNFDICTHDFNKVGDVATVTVTGYLSVDNFFKISQKAHSNSTSKDVIRSIAKSIGLKYSETDGLQTADKMTWLQRCSNLDFIKYISNNAYIVKDTPIIYADLNNTLNYKSLKKEIDSVVEPTLLEYKNDLFNMKTEVAVEKYKKDNKKPDKYGNCYSFEVKNIQQYLDNFIANGAMTYGIDHSSGNKEVTVINGKSYPILTNQGDFKSREGETAVVDFFGIKSESTYSEFHKAELENNYNLSSFFSQCVFTEVNWHCDLDLLEPVEVLFPSYVNNDATDLNATYSGKYVIGGMYYNLKVKNKQILPKKTIAMFRPGVNKSIYTD